MSESKKAIINYQQYRDLCDQIRYRNGISKVIKPADIYDLLHEPAAEHPDSWKPDAIQLIEGTLTSFNDVNNEIESVGSYAFSRQSWLRTVTLPVCTFIDEFAFDHCVNLSTIFLTNSKTMCTLKSTNAFNSCRALTSIYVPASLLDTYKADSTWSNFSDKIVAYTEE